MGVRNCDREVIERLDSKTPDARKLALQGKTTSHDFGSGITHKHVICWLRYDRALLRSNPSARLLPEHGWGFTALAEDPRHAPAMFWHSMR